MNFIERFYQIKYYSNTLQFAIMKTNYYDTLKSFVQTHYAKFPRRIEMFTNSFKHKPPYYYCFKNYNQQESCIRIKKGSEKV